MAAPLTAFGAEDAAKAAAGSTNAVGRESAGATDPVRESLLRELRPENLDAKRLDRLRRELRLRHGLGAQLKDLSTSDLLRLLGDVYAENGEREGAGDFSGGARRPQGRGAPDRRGMRGGGLPGGRRAGFRFGGGRPEFVETARGSQMMQINSRIFYGLLEDESGQDPEVAITEYEFLIKDFDEHRNNMAKVHFRLGRLLDKTGDTKAAAEQYRLVLRHYSDIAEVKADADKALKKLEGRGGGPGRDQTDGQKSLRKSN